MTRIASIIKRDYFMEMFQGPVLKGPRTGGWEVLV